MMTKKGFFMLIVVVFVASVASVASAYGFQMKALKTCPRSPSPPPVRVSA